VPVTINFLHADHGLTPAQRAFVEGASYHAASRPTSGLFFLAVELPPELGTVPCGIHGPSMGDAPVPAAEVTWERRSPDRGLSRMCDRAPRPIRTVQVIGVWLGSDVLDIYTAYGGPAVSPREVTDKNLPPEAAEESLQFWATHALSR